MLYSQLNNRGFMKQHLLPVGPCIMGGLKKLDISENEIGEGGAALLVGASLIQSPVGDTVEVVVGNAATSIFALLANWVLALVLFAILPLFGLQGFEQKKRSQGFRQHTKERTRRGQSNGL